MLYCQTHKEHPTPSCGWCTHAKAMDRMEQAILALSFIHEDGKDALARNLPPGVGQRVSEEMVAMPKSIFSRYEQMAVENEYLVKLHNMVRLFLRSRNREEQEAHLKEIEKHLGEERGLVSLPGEILSGGVDGVVAELCRQACREIPFGDHLGFQSKVNDQLNRNLGGVTRVHNVMLTLGVRDEARMKYDQALDLPPAPGCKRMEFRFSHLFQNVKSEFVDCNVRAFFDYVPAGDAT